MSLLVNEIFYSIQGESVYSGMPSIFIRLTGCNLRCSYCDTRYAYKEGVEMEISEILDKISSYSSPLIEITGGEPLLQAETPLLIQKLLEIGYKVMMETNGSLDIRSVDNACIKILDIKCPSSNESDKNDLENLNRLGPDDQVKFVIGNREDYEYAKKIVKNCLYSKNSSGIYEKIAADHILFSPVFGKIEPVRLAKWILEEKLYVRLHLQLHKIIWGDFQRGV